MIYRPVMRHFKCQGSSNVCWPLDDSEATDMETGNLDSEPIDVANKVILDLGAPRKAIM